MYVDNNVKWWIYIKKEIMAYISIYIIPIIILIVGLILKIYWLFFASILSYFVIGGLYLLLSDYKEKKYNLDLNKLKDKLKSKQNLDFFEELQLLCLQRKLSLYLKEKLKIKDISNIETKMQYMEYNVDIYYKYRNSEIYFRIKRSTLEFSIDIPEKYDYFKGNDVIEKSKKLSLESIKSMDDFISVLSDKIIEIKEMIVNFYDTAKVDNLFDGKTINMLESFKSFNRLEGIVIVIFSFIICLIMVVLTYQFIFNEQFRTFPINEIFEFQNILLTLGLAAMDGFGLFGLIFGLKHIIVYSKIKLDYINRDVLEIEGKITKVHIKYDSHRGHYRFKSIELKIEGIKIIISLLSFIVHNKYWINEFKNEIINTNIKAKYLKRSKLVTDGQNKYLGLVKKYCNKKK